jgi:hypothetical protein
MGTLFRFSCSGCSYKEDVSGGPDAGMLVQTETGVCGSCRRVVDVAVAVSVHWQGGAKGARPPLDVCPHCEGSNLRTWEDGACPRCGEYMEMGPVQLLWD